MPSADGRSFKRLEFEMALDLASGSGRSLRDTVGAASKSAGGELVMLLPVRTASDDVAELALVRFPDEGGRFLQVRSEGAALVVAEEDGIDPDLLGFARTSLALFERLKDMGGEENASAAASS